MSRQARQCKSLTQASIIAGQLYVADQVLCPIEDDRLLHVLDDPTITAIRLLSLSHGWQQRVWLDVGVSIVETINFQMTLRKEQRGLKAHWYAYRRVVGTLYKRYVGDSLRITEKRLLEVARAMPG